MSDVFQKVNVKDGKPKTCKFCHAEVWWHSIERRWYDIGGETLHVENCGRCREHYRNEAILNAETRRRQRTSR